LLLEDVDAAFVDRSANQGGARLTFSGLLNAIDGVSQYRAAALTSMDEASNNTPVLVQCLTGNQSQRMPKGCLKHDTAPPWHTDCCQWPAQH
jgi:hypothetical protein